MLKAHDMLAFSCSHTSIVSSEAINKIIHLFIVGSQAFFKHAKQTPTSLLKQCYIVNTPSKIKESKWANLHNTVPQN